MNERKEPKRRRCRAYGVAYLIGEHLMRVHAPMAAIIIASLAAVPSARADMSCSEFTRAYALQDAAALADARQIARPWIGASEESQVLLVGPAVGQQMLRLGPATY